MIKPTERLNTTTILVSFPVVSLKTFMNFFDTFLRDLKLVHGQVIWLAGRPMNISFGVGARSRDVTL